MSQSSDILEYLETGKKLTPLDALDKFKCFRLAARINDLRSYGHKIQMKERKEDGKRFAEYFIVIDDDRQQSLF